MPPSPIPGNTYLGDAVSHCTVGTIKYPHIITLSGPVFLALVVVHREGRAGSENNLSVGPFDGLMELTLAEGNRVRQGENDGTRVEPCHDLHDLLCKRALCCGEAQQGSWLNVFDDLDQGLEWWAAVITARKVCQRTS